MNFNSSILPPNFFIYGGGGYHGLNSENHFCVSDSTNKSPLMTSQPLMQISAAVEVNTTKGLYYMLLNTLI